METHIATTVAIRLARRTSIIDKQSVRQASVVNNLTIVIIHWSARFGTQKYDCLLIELHTFTHKELWSFFYVFYLLRIIIHLLIHWRNPQFQWLIWGFIHIRVSPSNVQNTRPRFTEQIDDFGIWWNLYRRRLKDTDSSRYSAWCFMIASFRAISLFLRNRESFLNHRREYHSDV